MWFPGRFPLVVAGLVGGGLGFLLGGLLAQRLDPELLTAARVVGMSLGIGIGVMGFDRIRASRDRALLASMTFDRLLPMLAGRVAEDTEAMLASVDVARDWTPETMGTLDIHDPIHLKAFSDQFAILIHDERPELAEALVRYFEAADDLQEVIDVAAGYVVLEDSSQGLSDKSQAATELALATYQVREMVGLPARPD